MKAVLRSTTAVNGAQSVMTTGTLTMLTLFVVSSATARLYRPLTLTTITSAGAVDRSGWTMSAVLVTRLTWSSVISVDGAVTIVAIMKMQL